MKSITEWAASLERVRERYPKPRIVVPGHGTSAGDSIGTTARLVAEAKAR